MKGKTRKYLCSILLFTLLYYLICFLTRGQYFDSIFFGDHKDTFADFFNCMYAWHENPYNTQSTNYPALAVLMYKFCYHFIPNSVYVNYGLEYRSVSSAWIIFLLFNIFTIWLSSLAITKILTLNSGNKTILSIVLLLSPPVMYALERGNIINLAFACTIFFVAYYNDENKYIRNIAYICLAIATAIKIYPAIFGIILLKEQKWNETFQLLFYGISFFFLPFIYYGKDSLINFCSGMLNFVESKNTTYGYGYNYSLNNLKDLFSSFFNVNISDSVYTLLLIILVLNLLLCFFITKTEWKKWLCISLLLIWIPSISFAYVTIFLIIPFIYFLNDLDNSKNNFSALLFSILFIPLALPISQRYSVDNYLLTFSYVVYFICLFILGLYLIIDMDITLIKELHIKK